MPIWRQTGIYVVGHVLPRYKGSFGRDKNEAIDYKSNRYRYNCKEWCDLSITSSSNFYKHSIIQTKYHPSNMVSL